MTNIFPLSMIVLLLFTQHFCVVLKPKCTFPLLCSCSIMSDKSELKAELERKKQRLAQIREEKKRKEEERKKKEVSFNFDCILWIQNRWLVVSNEQVLFVLVRTPSSRGLNTPVCWDTDTIISYILIWMHSCACDRSHENGIYAVICLSKKKR